MRISYFVDEKESEKSALVYQKFFANSGIQELKNHSLPRKIIIAEGYGGGDYEQRFRNYLNNYTQVGLDLLKVNLLHSRRLFTVYRFQVRQASISFEEFFESTFRKYSQYYRAFSNIEKKQFFEDLRTCLSGHKEWAHMMVNMIVGCDFPLFGFPFSIETINNVLTKNNLDFQIPETWNPQSFDVLENTSSALNEHAFPTGLSMIKTHTLTISASKS